MRSAVVTSLYTLAVLALVIAAPMQHAPKGALQQGIRSRQAQPPQTPPPNIILPVVLPITDPVPVAEQTKDVTTKPSAGRPPGYYVPVISPNVDPSISQDPTNTDSDVEKTTGEGIGNPIALTPAANEPTSANTTAKTPRVVRNHIAALRTSAVGKLVIKQASPAARSPAAKSATGTGNAVSNVGQQKLGPGGTDDLTGKPQPKPTADSRKDDYQYNAAYPCIWMHKKDSKKQTKPGDNVCPPDNTPQHARRSGVDLNDWIPSDGSEFYGEQEGHRGTQPLGEPSHL